MCATFFGNNTSIICLWKRILKAYHAIYKRKAFIHWYLGEGMEEAEFAQAVTNLEDLVSEYQMHSENFELPFYDEEEEEGGPEGPPPPEPLDDADG